MWTDICSIIAVLREEALLRSEETAEEVLRGVRAVADGLDAAARARHAAGAGAGWPDADRGALRADPVGGRALRRRPGGRLRAGADRAGRAARRRVRPVHAGRHHGEADAGAGAITGSFERVSSKETQNDTHLVMV